LDCFSYIAGKTKKEEDNIWGYGIHAYRMCPAEEKEKGFFQGTFSLG
jgi:hypothetical protein